MATTIGDRIREARAKLKMTQPDLAKACGWKSQGRVSNYERNLREPKSGDIALLAKALRVSEAWLWTGSDSNASPAPPAGPQRRYPIICSVQAGSWTEIVTPYEPGAEQETRPTDYQAKDRAFWLVVEGDSMVSLTGADTSIPEGSLVLFDTGIEATPGKLVAAVLGDSNEAVFKRLVTDGGKRYLKPHNSTYPLIPINGNCRILGVAVEIVLRP